METKTSTKRRIFCECESCGAPSGRIMDDPYCLADFGTCNACGCEFWILIGAEELNGRKI